MKTFLIFILLTISFSTFGQSQIIDVLSSSPDYIPYKNSIDSSFEKCNNTWTTNLEWGACLGEHEQLWEKLMLQFYDSLMIELNTTGQKLLKSSQTDWTNHQRTQKDFWGYFEDISPASFGREGHFKAYYHDLYAIRDRAVELRAYLEILRENKKSNDGKK